VFKNQPSDTERAILITGCSSGIGRHAAETLARRGYRVFATTRRRADTDELAGQGLEALTLDLSDPASIHGAVDSILEKTGGQLYALFNNGAYGQPGAVEDLSRAALREQFETNLFGWQELTNRVIPVMRRRQEGRIIQNSSILGFIALKYRGAYIASKYALEGLSDTMRLELRGSGIHVCLIQPGPILSRFRQNAYQAYLRHIEPDHSVHADHYRKMATRFQQEEAVQPFTLPPEAVVKRVIHALESPRPQARYPVTFPTYLFAWLKRGLSSRALDAVLNKTG
jgi:NAD(P)-dependent dehydrogenase (short-subunit alcohol dehydrogenase family)